MTISFSERPAVIFLIGGLGAGKTELAINLAVTQAERCGSGHVDLLDLDIVNPFFRVRQVKDEVQTLGVNVVTPDARVMNGDLPALPAQIWASLENLDRTIVCDVGGGELGLRPLARLKEFALRRETSTYFVVNPFRPGFLSLPEMTKSFRHMEELSSLTVTHLVANPHLIGETTVDIYQRGYAQVAAFSQQIGVPIAFGMATPTIREALPPQQREGILPLRRFWGVPWAFGAGKENE